MKPFFILSPGIFVCRTATEISIRAFAKLYHNVSPKHQRKLKLIMIEEQDHRKSLAALAKNEKIQHALQIIDREKVEKVKTAYRSASLFLYPSTKNGYKIISEALSFGLPILSYQHEETKQLLDVTCSMLIKPKRNEAAFEKCSKTLQMLYFDPEVRKILEIGAQHKLRKEMNWGRSRKQSA